MSVSRRQFLTSIGVGSFAAVCSRAAATVPPVFPSPRRKGPPPAFFTPIGPSTKDELVLPDGVTFDLLLRWNDPLGSTDPTGRAEHFGFNCDFNCFFPMDARTGGTAADEGLLWTNHEYPHPLFVSNYPPNGTTKKTAAQIQTERRCVGGSVTHVKRTNGKWAHVPGPVHNRRFCTDYPDFAMTGPVARRFPTATGTLANCSGGRTPWHTVITCEENYPDFNGHGQYEYRWSDVPELAIDETKFGWIAEIDPFGELPPRKHSALGRFKHENAAVRTGKTGKLVVYMGDDEVDQHLYKFVSATAVDPNAPRAEQRKVLESGTLFAADLAKGKWIPLVYSTANRVKIEQSEAFKTARDSAPAILDQGDLLIHTRFAAKALGATPLDRCEDCEIHPLDGSLYVALTNNTRHGNLFGHILRLVEANDDCEGDSFAYEIFLAGGPPSGLACPDNLAFDAAGNLWVVCDMSSEKIGRGAYQRFGNNGLFVVPTAGDSAGDAFQFASGPVQSELTGPWFTADGTTLFLSVQHPGEESESMEKLTSRWPDGGVPKPSVVAVKLR